eukprot:scaffold4384_cov367-Prasinococcus_capsulatus_cf.AAC.13
MRAASRAMSFLSIFGDIRLETLRAADCVERDQAGSYGGRARAACADAGTLNISAHYYVGYLVGALELHGFQYIARASHAHIHTR